MSDIPSEAEQRAIWRSAWLSSLQAFADIQTQRCRWTDPNETNPAYSFVECICGYFDDAFMRDEADYQRKLDRGHLSRQEMDAVIEFHRQAAGYRPPNDDDYDVSAILADPAWRRLTMSAEEARNRLLPLLADEHERILLTQPRVWKQRDGTFYAEETGTTYVGGS